MSDALSQEHRPQLQKLRRFLRAEAKVLNEELGRLSEETGKRLKTLEKKIADASDRALLADGAEWKEELTAIRRGLGRFSLSGRDAGKLKNEWHDWERHASFSDPSDHETKRERQEMILSELWVRGLKLPNGVERSARTAVTPSVPLVLKREASDSLPLSTRGAGGVTEEEDVCRDPRDPCLPYWEQLVAGLDAENMDTSQLTRLFKAFRAVHGEQKGLDRQKGARRFRLTAFEGWTR